MRDVPDATAQASRQADPLGLTYDGRSPTTLSKELPIRRAIAAFITAVAVVAIAVPALAASGNVNVPKKFSKLIPKVAKKSQLLIRLPSSIHVFVKPSKTFADGSATRNSYFLELDAAKSCHGANACFLASFSGTRNGTPAFKKTVSLVNGITGYFKPVTCGASCSPAFIQWKEHGVLYEIENKGVGKNEKASMVKLANSAIRGGDR
jgi:hypothetical protein